MTDILLYTREFSELNQKGYLKEFFFFKEGDSSNQALVQHWLYTNSK